MAVDVARDERTERHDIELLTPRVVEGGRGEPASEAVALESFLDLGVRERETPVAAPVGGDADRPAVCAELVPAPIGHVDELELACLRDGTRGRRLEVFEQLP